jgi:DNA-binding transcriptional regulator WhiA
MIDKTLITIMFVMIWVMPNLGKSLAASVELDDDECLVKIDEYFSKIEIPANVMERVKIARQYYKSGGTIVAPLELESLEDCNKFENESVLKEIKTAVPCYNNLSESNSNALQLIVQSSESAKNVLEACFACMSGHYSFAMMNLFGLLNQYLDRAIER